MKRRDLLKGVAALAISPKIAEAQLSQQDSGSSSHQEPPPSDLSVTFSGGPFHAPTTFAGSNAVYVGPDYIGEYVRQKWFACKVAAYPLWTVWFRVDADGSGNRIVAPAAGWRDEVVVEYGVTDATVKPTDITSPYSCAITKNGVKVYSVSDIAASERNYHYWFSRWRWAQDAHGSGAGHWRSKVVRTPRSLIARGWLPNYTTDGLFNGGRPTTGTYSGGWPGPMGMPVDRSGAFDPAMGAGGDNVSIGYLTEYAANYVLFGGSDFLRCTMLQGEWVGSWQIFMRDREFRPRQYQSNPHLGLPGTTNPGGYSPLHGITGLTLKAGSGYRDGTYPLAPASTANWVNAGGFVGTVTVSGGRLTRFSIAQPGSAYWPEHVTIAVPPAAGAGIGGAITPNLGPVGVELNVSHWYPASALPWMLTDDPFHLEGMQFGAAYAQGYAQWYRNYFKIGGLPAMAEARAFAWGVRDIARCAAMTPESVPVAMYPRSYWLASLADCKTFAMRYVNNPCTIYSVFRQITVANLCDPWMAAWETTVFGMCCDLGFGQDWLPIFTWAAGLQILMASNYDPKAGWPRQYFAAYECCFMKPPNFQNALSDNLIFEWEHDNSQVYASAAAAWADFAAGKNGSPGHIDTSGWDESTGIKAHHDYTSFALHVRSALAQAARYKINGASACYDWVQRNMTTWLASLRHVGQARFSLGP